VWRDRLGWRGQLAVVLEERVIANSGRLRGGKFCGMLFGLADGICDGDYQVGERAALCRSQSSGVHTSQLRYQIVLAFKASSRFESSGIKVFHVEETPRQPVASGCAWMGALKSTT
jgi:hypothetical protein